MPTQTAPQTLAHRLRALPTADLVDRLVTDARRMTVDGEQRAHEVAAAAVVLAARHGRTSDVGSRDLTDPMQALAERIDAAGGALAVSAGDIRRAMAPAILASARAYEVDPTPGQPYVRPSAAALLESAGIATLPSTTLPAGEAPHVVLHNTRDDVGRLLAALAAGDQDDAAAYADTLTSSTPAGTAR
ncbi:hypothetical protein [Streptomyces sp. CAI-85]|uniref:hypothetical protein n=1 Tax=Streptomyces sp. CAI-85 TaxID=1472662 RepID=UPI00158783D6|nr:hypothetical protein [Streptomyces sp. CAI-85]NUV64997.1 hypothetical protein [Streptomyces sp. CAI-85]